MKITSKQERGCENSTSAAPVDAFNRIGLLTRTLHDAKKQLELIAGLQRAAEGLPDVRSRLNYVAQKTSEAADKVLTSVDGAKAEREAICEATKSIGLALVADPVRVVASGDLKNFVEEVGSRTEVIDAHLRDIMLAQEFQDLTGQTVSKVLAMAIDIEKTLVAILVEVAPVETKQVESKGLDGPVVNYTGRTDVVANQSEVDDLLSSLGF